MSVAAWPSFVISLARQPQRLRRFRELNKAVGLDIRAFEAVEGRDLIARKLIKHRQLADGATFTPGALGTAMSHHALWTQCVETDQAMLVFEDDARLRDDFVPRADALLDQVSDFDIVLFGFNTDHPIHVDLFAECGMLCQFMLPYPSAPQIETFAGETRPPAALRLHGLHGTCGYAISPKGARTLLDRCFPLDNRPVRFTPRSGPYAAFGIDSIMNTVYGELSAYVAVPPLVLTPNDQKTSQTGGVAALKRP